MERSGKLRVYFKHGHQNLVRSGLSTDHKPISHPSCLATSCHTAQSETGRVTPIPQGLLPALRLGWAKSQSVPTHSAPELDSLSLPFCEPRPPGWSPPSGAHGETSGNEQRVGPSAVGEDKCVPERPQQQERQLCPESPLPAPRDQVKSLTVCA